MPTRSAQDLRELILITAKEQEPTSSSGPHLTQTQVLQAVWERLGKPYDQDLHAAVLTQWHDLMRTGYFAWGLNFSSPGPPFFHFTERGRRALSRLTRDPGNPAGYLRHISTVATLNPITNSYLSEGLDCYTSGLHKAAAVMLGGASESLILELRDVLVKRMKRLKRPVPRRLDDWRVKIVLDTLYNELDSRASQFPRELREEFQAYWLAFSQQIRAARNEAGHPTSVEPVTEEAVHAGFLVFPELLRLQSRMVAWVPRNFR